MLETAPLPSDLRLLVANWAEYGCPVPFNEWTMDGEGLGMKFDKQDISPDNPFANSQAGNCLLSIVRNTHKVT